MSTENEGFGVWALVELLGHVKMAGYVTEEELFGSKLGRIDIAADDDVESITQYFSGNSVYRITPLTEATARAFARRSRPRPVYTYELLPAPRHDNSDEPPNFDHLEEDGEPDYFDDKPF